MERMHLAFRMQIIGGVMPSCPARLTTQAVGTSCKSLFLEDALLLLAADDAFDTAGSYSGHHHAQAEQHLAVASCALLLQPPSGWRPADLQLFMIMWNTTGSSQGAWVFLCSYGPRPSDRWVGFSEEGRLDCDVKMAPFSSWQRTKWGQVRSLGQQSRPGLALSCASFVASVRGSTTW